LRGDVARSDDEVIQVLREIYAENFGGKEDQRFLISWGDLRAIYGFRKLFNSRFEQLVEVAHGKRFYLWDLGEGENGRLIAVIRTATVDRWRRVPKKIIEAHRSALDDNGDEDEDESE
jgi:hypothetical protein